MTTQITAIQHHPLQVSEVWPTVGRTTSPNFRVVDLDTIGGRINWGRQELRACRARRVLQEPKGPMSSAAVEEYTS